MMGMTIRLGRRFVFDRMLRLCVPNLAVLVAFFYRQIVVTAEQTHQQQRFFDAVFTGEMIFTAI